MWHNKREIREILDVWYRSDYLLVELIVELLCDELMAMPARKMLVLIRLNSCHISLGANHTFPGHLECFTLYFLQTITLQTTTKYYITTITTL